MFALIQTITRGNLYGYLWLHAEETRKYELEVLDEQGKTVHNSFSEMSAEDCIIDLHDILEHELLRVEY
jgi:hypothetical protein